MDDFIALVEKVNNKFLRQKKAFYPFIEHIRFPKYKLLQQNLKINFKFPITLLVGKNGINKTSILQALYGSPEGKSLGEYWFTTSLDKIDRVKDRDKDQRGKTSPHCLIYGYYFEKAERIVEVLKTRINKKMNLDYWEPARPARQYGMDILTKEEYQELGSSLSTRWDGMKKDVVYCDCKEYVSAYDLFFYHYDFQSTKKINTKQDFIRSRSKLLSAVLEKNEESHFYFGKEMVEQHIEVSNDVCRIVSEIMGELYSSIRIVTHKFYTKGEGGKAAKTIWMRKNGDVYSEAFAGTGEARIILLVNDIINAPVNSLLLIDEPEISLHPSAIYKLKNFLLRECLKKNHQIVITTHSIQMVKDFPKKAIKLVSKIDNEIKVFEDIDFQEAFYELGDAFRDKKNIFVEDRLSKYIVDFIIKRENKSHLKNNIEVKSIPGGADNIIGNYIKSSALQGLDNCLFVLDGDKRIDFNNHTDVIKKEYLSEGKVDINKIPESDFSNLGKIIQTMTGVDIDIKVSGNSEITNESELREAQKKVIAFWGRHVKFLPCDTPENFLKDLDHDIRFWRSSENDKNGKSYFIRKTKSSLGVDEITSDDIFEEQKRIVSKIDKENTLYKSVISMLEGLF